MELDHFNQFLTQASLEGVVFYHAGALDEATVVSLGALVRQRLQEAGASGAKGRKVFAVFMEMAQNILHYAAGDGTATGRCDRLGAVAVVRAGEGFQVLCGNYLPAAETPRVRQRLEEVRAMDPEAVRRSYRRQLTADTDDPHSKGAGLGLLTMAASANAPLEFAFAPDPPGPGGHAFLFLKATI
jgi:hypothetical protein